MTPFSLTSKFYIVFSVLFSVPAFWISSKISEAINYLPETNIIHHLSSVGVIEAPTAIIILVAFFTLFNNCIWRIPLIRKLLNIPDIQGRYVGELKSTFTETKEENGTYRVAVEIKQTLTKIKVFLYTERSFSYGLIANICTNYNDNHELVYLYQNKTSAIGADANMRDHHGVASLQILKDGEFLSGNYFNNPRERGRYGNIDVTRESRKLKGGF